MMSPSPVRQERTSASEGSALQNQITELLEGEQSYYDDLCLVETASRRCGRYSDAWALVDRSSLRLSPNLLPPAIRRSSPGPACPRFCPKYCSTSTRSAHIAAPSSRLYGSCRNAMPTPMRWAILSKGRRSSGDQPTTNTSPGFLWPINACARRRRRILPSATSSRYVNTLDTEL